MLRQAERNTSCFRRKMSSAIMVAHGTRFHRWINTDQVFGTHSGPERTMKRLPSCSVSVNDRPCPGDCGGARQDVQSMPRQPGRPARNIPAWLQTERVLDWLQAERGVGNALQGFSVALSGDGKTTIVGGLNDNSGAGSPATITTLQKRHKHGLGNGVAPSMGGAFSQLAVLGFTIAGAAFSKPAVLI
jgi:hypothetical protein